MVTATIQLKVTERGWAAHFICSPYCRFRRNTLIEYGDQSVIVSTVGEYREPETNRVLELGVGRYYETAVWGTKFNGIYVDIDIARPFFGEWRDRRITTFNEHTDQEANDMHENIVKAYKHILSVT